MWKNLEEIIGDKQKSKGQSDIVFRGINYTDESMIADKFNEYFIESIDEIVKEFETR